MSQNFETLENPRKAKLRPTRKPDTPTSALGVHTVCEVEPELAHTVRLGVSQMLSPPSPSTTASSQKAREQKLKARPSW